MRLRVLIISLYLIPCCIAVLGQAKRDVDPKNAGPLVEDCNPKIGSIGSIIELKGYRLYPGWHKTKVFFIQNEVELPAQTTGGSAVTNDAHNGTQFLKVVVPEEIALGPAQVVVEGNGQRSIPATVTIAEWKVPVIKRVTPTRGAPGTFVEIEGEGFHINDEIEVTDVDGNPVRYNGGGSSKGTGFGVHEETPEGVLTIRIGNNKYGKGQYTEPFTFVVTNDPLPIELITSYMTSVAPGQWLDLQVSHSGPLKHSERTEVAFKQAGREIIVAAPKPFRPRVAVPGVLSAGEVELQVRTWRDGRPSEWSEPVVFKLADKPLAPSIGGIRLAEGKWVHLWPGPDRPTSFTVKPGAEVVLNGRWPVADANKLIVTLVRPGEVITLTAKELSEKAGWFSDVQVRLPDSLAPGEWRLVVTSETDGTHDEAPMVIRVVKN